jgi:hypothetical protein
VGCSTVGIQVCEKILSTEDCHRESQVVSLTLDKASTAETPTNIRVVDDFYQSPFCGGTVGKLESALNIRGAHRNSDPEPDNTNLVYLDQSLQW